MLDTSKANCLLRVAETNIQYQRTYGTCFEHRNCQYNQWHVIPKGCPGASGVEVCHIQLGARGSLTCETHGLQKKGSLTVPA